MALESFEEDNDPHRRSQSASYFSYSGTELRVADGDYDLVQKLGFEQDIPGRHSSLVPNHASQVNKLLNRTSHQVEPSKKEDMLFQMGPGSDANKFVLKSQEDIRH